MFGAYLYTAVGSKSTNSCIQLLPTTATVSPVENSTFAGYQISYGNGTIVYSQVGVCPSPVYSQLYDAVSNVTADPRFTRAANGVQYVVDPVDSMTGPLTANNGTVFAELIFNNLNQSSTVYPCNLNFISKSPISAIFVFIPVLGDGTLLYANESITEVPGSQLQFNCQQMQETGSTTFAKSQIPPQFQVGSFDFNLVSNGTNFVGVNGTSYPGYDYAFNVNYPSSNLTQQVVFTWPSASDLSGGKQPEPFILSPYGAYVVMRWFTNSTGLYLVVTTRA